MKRSAFLVAVAALAAALAAAGARAGSIWARANAGGPPVRIYEDDTARHVGDILTVVIVEKSSVDNDTKRNMDKKSDRSITSSGNINLKDVPTWWGGRSHDGFNIPTISATSSGSSQFQGDVKLQSDRTLTDTITVTVHDVLPNGNLVVLGCRQRNVEGDVQMICVSGIVRPSDITFANTVNSGQVADFRMVTVVGGTEGRFTNPGWLGRILNFLSPW